MIENLCFSGGGVKGYAYIGVLKYLEEIKQIDNIKNFSCTSVGSLFSTLVVCGYTSEELRNIVYNLDFSYLENVNINNLFDNYGLDNMKGISSLMKILIDKKGIDKNITFKELHTLTNKGLYITCTKLKDYSQKIFSFKHTPDEKIIEACVYSCTIPFIFSINKDKMYIDGCFSTNLPIEVFPIENTIGFFLPQNIKDQEITKFNEYVLNVVNCMLHRSNLYELETYTSRGYKLINIKSFTSSLNFSITKDIIDRQILSGYESIFKDIYPL